MIPFSDSLAIVLKEYVQHKNRLPIGILKNECFFIALDGIGVARDAAYRWFRKILVRAGIAHNDHGPILHSLRHSLVYIPLP